MEGPQPIPEIPTATFRKRTVKSKSTLRKRASTPSPSHTAVSDYTSSENEEGRQVKRPRKTVGVAVKSTAVRLQSENVPHARRSPILSTTTTDATKSSDWYDEDSSRARPNVQAEADDTHLNSRSAVSKRPDQPSKQVGPVKSSTNVRTITVTDFAPDVCKDYKQTGFCGFGDSCKFLHAREDYKQGWELDRDWEIGTKGKRLQRTTVASANRSSKTGDEEDDDVAFLESVPFACVICKQAYKNSIVTKCEHYFCEACALQRYRKNPSCAICGAGTGGVFNVARKLNTALSKKQEREKQIEGQTPE